MTAGGATRQQPGRSPLPALALVYLAWILITAVTPYLGHLIRACTHVGGVSVSPWGGGVAGHSEAELIADITNLL